MAAPATVWTGSISFGLVNIPVGLSKAQDKQAVSFRTLHRECGSPISERKWCPTHEREITLEETVKGYEYAKDMFVIVEDADLAAILPEKDSTIDVRCFVPDDGSIDPLMVEKSYYLIPAKEANRRAGYALLFDAMVETGRIAVASFVLRDKQNLCVVRPFGAALVLDLLYYAEDIRTPEGIEDLVGNIEVGRAEKQLAKKIIQAYASDFDHGAFRNDHRDRIRAMLEELCEGKHPDAAERFPAQATVDLTAALKATIEAASKPKKEKQKPPKQPARKRKKKVAA